jgi:hypothetical protein
LHTTVKFLYGSQVQSVIRPEPARAGAKGAVINGIFQQTGKNKMRVCAPFPLETPSTTTILLETFEVFNPEIHPEYHRIPSPDGQDRCRYRCEEGIVVTKGEQVPHGKPIRFLVQKLLIPGESAIFEDIIYAYDSDKLQYLTDPGMLTLVHRNILQT